MSGAPSHKRRWNKPFINIRNKTRSQLSQAWPTSATGRRPHRRRDSPTSEVGHPHICARTTAATRTSVARCMCATAQGRVRPPWSSLRRCSSCRCSG
jgi:hypothetical protein